MSASTLTTFGWVPETPRGYVRDLRVRWASEEAGLAYRVESVPFRARPRRMEWMWLNTTFLSPYPER